MGAFWSSIDVATSDRLAETTDVFLSLVIGMNHKMVAKLQIMKKRLMYDLDIEIDGNKGNPFIAEYTKVFKKRVSKQVYKPLPPLPPYYPPIAGERGYHTESRPLVNTEAARSSFRDYEAGDDTFWDEKRLTEAEYYVARANEHRAKIGLPPLPTVRAGEIRGLPALPLANAPIDGTVQQIKELL